MSATLPIPKNAKIYLDKPYVKVFWDSTNKILSSQWTGFCEFDEITAVGKRILDAVNFEEAKKVLYDARQIEMLDEASKNYITGNFTRQMIKAGVKYAAAVFPEDVLAKLSIDHIQEKLDKGTDVNYFNSLSNAFDWLKKK